jgi:predicted TIM-barrel fold metal-dependent hydrolase
MKFIKKTLLGATAAILILFVAHSLINATDERQLLPFPDNSVTDFHVHVAGLGYGGSGCYVNEKMRENFRFGFYLQAMGVLEQEMETHGDQVVFEKLSHSLRTSRMVKQVVVLAMDGVIDRETGKLDKQATQVFIPNDYVFEQTSKRNNMIFGASINPYRADAIERLDRAHAQGAVLIKWIPSIMYIDPSDEAIRSFYQRMRELNMPLLSHTGMEKSFPEARDELADPLRLALPLEMGLTVIAAHIATTGTSAGQDNFERILPMFRKYENLYTDISSLTQINKLGFLQEALQIEGLANRFIYGTDWPLQFFPLISPWYHLDQISVADAKTIDQIENQWDRDIALKVAMGVPLEVFNQGQELFLR